MARLQYQPATKPRGFQPIQLSRAGIARMEEEGNRVIRNLQQQQAATNDQRGENLQAMRSNSAYEDQARENEDGQGWEECVDSAMTHLLRTVLAKSAKDTSSMPLPIAMPADTTKLQRHIGVICNRLSQKGSLAV